MPRLGTAGPRRMLGSPISINCPRPALNGAGPRTLAHRRAPRPRRRAAAPSPTARAPPHPLCRLQASWPATPPPRGASSRAAAARVSAATPAGSTGARGAPAARYAVLHPHMTHGSATPRAGPIPAAVHGATLGPTEPPCSRRGRQSPPCFQPRAHARAGRAWSASIAAPFQIPTGARGRDDRPGRPHGHLTSRCPADGTPPPHAPSPSPSPLNQPPQAPPWPL